MSLIVLWCSGVRAGRRGAGRLLLAAALLVLLPVLSGCGAASISLVGRLEGVPAERLAVARSVVYVLNQDGLQIIDVADPERPQVLGSLALPGHPDALVADERRVYLSLHLAQGEDVAQDATLRDWLEQGLLTFGSGSFSAGIFQGASYLVIVDVGDSEQPQVVGVVSTTPVDAGYHDTRRIIVVGDRAFLVGEAGGVLVVDVGDPTHPQVLGPLAPPSAHLEVSGPLLYLAGRALPSSASNGEPAAPGGLQIIDITDLNDPQTLGGLDAEVLGGDAQFVLRNGTLIYLALSSRDGAAAEHYLVTIDIADPARPREIGRLKIEHAIDRMERTAARLFLLHSGGLTVLDLANPDAPTVSAHYDLQSALSLADVREVSIDGLLTYIAAGDDGLVIAGLEP